MDDLSNGSAWVLQVVNWRNGVEKDIDEVLQSQMVFMNVSKGQAANKKDLKKYFGTEDHTAVCIKILDGGVLQVSDKEREVEYANMFRDIAMRVADMCVNPESNRPYTLGVIDRSMRETLHYAVKPSKSAKLQALEVVRLLQKHMPITRAQIKIRASFPGGSGESESRDPLEVLVADLKRLGVTNHTPVDGQPGVIDVLIDPGHYRVVDEMVTKRSAGA